MKHALDLIEKKKRHTDFAHKLDELKERIDVFNAVFGSRKPKYIHMKYIEKKKQAERDEKRKREALRKLEQK